MVARFHSGCLDGMVIPDWPDPPAPSAWAERIPGGEVMTADPGEAQDGSPGYDRYSLAEIVADLAVYHFVEP
jgi:hypothetical protein